jgi:plasmid maintenance system antidote protein VapI
MGGPVSAPKWPSASRSPFNTTAESWLAQQLQYDLWHAEKRRKQLRVSRLSAA